MLDDQEEEEEEEDEEEEEAWSGKRRFRSYCTPVPREAACPRRRSNTTRWTGLSSAT